MGYDFMSFLLFFSFGFGFLSLRFPFLSLLLSFVCSVGSSLFCCSWFGFCLFGVFALWLVGFFASCSSSLFFFFLLVFTLGVFVCPSHHPEIYQDFVSLFFLI